MADYDQYTDSESERNPEHHENTWKPIGALAKEAMRKSVEAMNDGNYELAEAYHDRAVTLGMIGGDE